MFYLDSGIQEGTLFIRLRRNITEGKLKKGEEMRETRWQNKKIFKKKGIQYLASQLPDVQKRKKEIVDFL